MCLFVLGPFQNHNKQGYRHIWVARLCFGETLFCLVLRGCSFHHTVGFERKPKGHRCYFLGSNLKTDAPTCVFQKHFGWRKLGILAAFGGNQQALSRVAQNMGACAIHLGYISHHVTLCSLKVKQTFECRSSKRTNEVQS